MDGQESETKGTGGGLEARLLFQRLHDGLSQIATALATEIYMLNESLPEERPNHLRRLQRLSSLLTTEVCTLLNDLRPRDG